MGTYVAASQPKPSPTNDLIRRVGRACIAASQPADRPSPAVRAAPRDTSVRLDLATRCAGLRSSRKRMRCWSPTRASTPRCGSTQRRARRSAGSPSPSRSLFCTTRCFHTARAPCGGLVLEKPIVTEYPSFPISVCRMRRAAHAKLTKAANRAWSQPTRALLTPPLPPHSAYASLGARTPKDNAALAAVTAGGPYVYKYAKPLGALRPECRTSKEHTFVVASTCARAAAERCSGAAAGPARVFVGCCDGVSCLVVTTASGACTACTA